jgi:hypothetical protein
MSDDDVPTMDTGEPGEPWVTGDGPRPQHVPGIDDVPDTTYVEKSDARSARRAMLIGGAIGLAVVAIFAVVVLSGGSDNKTREEAVVGPDATLARSSTTTSTSTSSTSTTTTSAPPVTSTTLPPATVATAAPAPPTPRATADPAAAPYVPQSLPAGVSGTLTSCSWQPTAGGQYEAAGTLTNGPANPHGWAITIHWLQNSREIAQASTVVDITASQSKPWSLTLAAPVPPADPFSCALSAS